MEDALNLIYTKCDSSIFNCIIDDRHQPSFVKLYYHENENNSQKRKILDVQQPVVKLKKLNTSDIEKNIDNDEDDDVIDHLMDNASIF